MEQPFHTVVAHVDLDAFYAQVEMKQHPQLRGLPVGVVQYNPYGDLETKRPDEDRRMNGSNGSLIAVSYEARAAGVKRNMRGSEARAACPEINLVQVPTAHGKADLTLYRAEGKRVLDILARLAKTERASIDECYLDLTEEARRRLGEGGGVPPPPVHPEQVHVMVGGAPADAAAWWHRPEAAWGPGERLLAAAAAAVSELRDAVQQELGYSCSAGVAHTKLLAKLCSGLHKPAQQTVLPAAAVPALLAPLPIPKLRGLGGKFGETVMSELGIETVGQLAATPLARLEAAFGEKEARWLAGLAVGVTDEAVEERKLAKSVSCGKTFRGRHALRDLAAVRSWLLELGGELSERLEADREANNRMPQLLTVGFASTLPWGAAPGGGVQAAAGHHSTSRSCPLRKPTAEAMADDATALIKRWAGEQGSGWSIASLSLGASSFVPVQSAASAITRFFKPAAGAAAGAAADGAAAGEQQQQAQQQEADAGGPSSSAAAAGAAAGPSARQQQPPHALQQPSPPPPQRQRQQHASDGGGPGVPPVEPGGIDETVLAELPPDMQREIRAQLKMEQMRQRMGGGGRGSGAAGTTLGAAGKRPPSAGGGAAQQQRIDALFKGKRPKR